MTSCVSISHVSNLNQADHIYIYTKYYIIYIMLYVGYIASIKTYNYIAYCALYILSYHMNLYVCGQLMAMLLC